MVEGSSFFLIINDVIITSIPLFKIINVLNHFMILSTSSYFSTYNAFRFVATVFWEKNGEVWVHGFIRMSNFVIVSIDQLFRDVNNDGQFCVIFCVKLVAASPLRNGFKIQEEGLKGPHWC